MLNLERLEKIKKVARRMAKDAGQSEELWFYFLVDAYREVVFGKEKD